MKARAVYRKAAKMIEAEQRSFCCHAIYQASGLVMPLRFMAPDLEQCPLMNQFEALFSPSLSEVSEPWGCKWRGKDDSWDDEKNCRVLALLLMSEIARSEE